MASTVSVVFCSWHPNKIVKTKLNNSEAITTDGSAQTASNIGESGDDCVEVATSGGAIWVTLDGTDPEAGVGFYLPDGTTRTFDAGPGTVVKVLGDA